MTNNTIDDLREHLFATLTALRDKENPMPIDRAKAIADVAQVVINTAKVEVDMIEAVGPKAMRPTGFIPSGESTSPALTAVSGTPVPGHGLPARAPTGTL